MAPRPHRLTAQEREDKMNSSLRSFFPLEVVNEVLSHLDQSSLASLCRVSFHSLEEAGPQLMKHIRITDGKGFRTFFLQPSCLVTTRLQPHLQTTYMRTLEIRVHWRDYPTDIALSRMTVSKDEQRAFPEPHRLLRLTVALPAAHFHQLLSDRILSYFNPVHLEILAVPDRQDSSFASGLYGTFLRCSHPTWAALRRVSSFGWLGLYLFDDPVPPSFIVHLPPSKEPIDLEWDFRGWDLFWTGEVVRAFSLSGALEERRLRRICWTLTKGEQETTAREGLATLPKEARDKFELVVVAEGS